MIKVKYVEGIDSRTFWQCPKCRTTDCYFVEPQSECEYCNTKVPDFRLLKLSLMARKNYYKKGT